MWRAHCVIPNMQCTSSFHHHLGPKYSVLVSQGSVVGPKVFQKSFFPKLFPDHFAQTSDLRLCLAAFDLEGTLNDPSEGPCSYTVQQREALILPPPPRLFLHKG